MKDRKKESASLWNIAVDESIASINDGVIEKRFDKAVARFRKRLDAIVEKRASEIVKAQVPK